MKNGEAIRKRIVTRKRNKDWNGDDTDFGGKKRILSGVVNKYKNEKLQLELFFVVELSQILFFVRAETADIRQTTVKSCFV